MAIVPIIGLILNVCRVNGDTTSTLFRRLVDLVVVGELGTSAFSQNLGDSSSQRSLAVVDVSFDTVSLRPVDSRHFVLTDGTNVHVRLSPRELLGSGFGIPTTRDYRDNSRLRDT